MNIKVPHGSILRDPITVGGYKFFYFQGKGELLCATCFNISGLTRDPEVPQRKGKVAELVIRKDCDCPKQI